MENAGRRQRVRVGAKAIPKAKGVLEGGVGVPLGRRPFEVFGSLERVTRLQEEAEAKLRCRVALVRGGL
jgi:hypothetical protein